MTAPGTARGSKKIEKKKKMQPNDLDTATPKKLCICLCINFSSV